MPYGAYRNYTGELFGRTDGVREEIKIFGLIDGLTARNPQKALDAYQRLRAQGEENIPMLAMINRQFQTLAMVKYYQEKAQPG